MGDLARPRSAASDVDAAIIPEECPGCEQTELRVEIHDDDLLLACRSCGRRWRYGLGYLLPIPRSSE